MSQSTVETTLPRIIDDGLLWTGGCVQFDYDGDQIHGHMCAFVVAGSDKTLFVDTGHPAHAESVDRDLDAFLGGRPLDYVFPTHPEMPHAGNLARWLRKYPDAQVVGDVRDLHLYYPEHEHRFLQQQAGQQLDLGDSTFIFIEAIWKDLPNTLWGYDTKSRALFVADGFAYTHYHREGQCAQMSGERPPPIHRQTVFINERALYWTRYTDVSNSFAEIDALLARLSPRFIAPAHGGLIDTIDDLVPLLKAGMQSMRVNRGDGPVGY